MPILSVLLVLFYAGINVLLSDKEFSIHILAFSILEVVYSVVGILLLSMTILKRGIKLFLYYAVATAIFFCGFVLALFDTGIISGQEMGLMVVVGVILIVSVYCFKWLNKIHA